MDRNLLIHALIMLLVVRAILAASSTTKARNEVGEVCKRARYQSQ